jgi:hypothetical protein
MGKTLDIYFRFAADGDYYLGQLLSLKDPMKAEFATPCPHWKDPSAERVLATVRLTFGKVLIEHEDSDHDPSGFLSLLLGSMVHHIDWMLQICANDSIHLFNQIPLLSSPLLAELCDYCLTMELNDHVPRLTGIPPHVEHTCQMRDLTAETTDMRSDICAVREDLVTAVSDAIDKNVDADGGVNAAILQASVKGLEERFMQKLDELGVKPASTTPQVDTVGSEVNLADMSRAGGEYASFTFEANSGPYQRTFSFLWK